MNIPFKKQKRGPCKKGRKKTLRKGLQPNFDYLLERKAGQKKTLF